MIQIFIYLVLNFKLIQQYQSFTAQLRACSSIIYILKYISTL